MAKPRIKYNKQYTEHLQAIEATLQLIDGILENRSPLLEVASGGDRLVAQLRQAKVALSILTHALQRAVEGRL